MKADVSFHPAVQPWSEPTATHLDPSGWDSSSCHGPRQTMLQSSPDPGPQWAQLDFFHKLGYSTAQVQAVQRKFGTDTDKVLGELVRIGAGPEPEQRPVTNVSVLVSGRAPQLPVGDPPLQNREEDGEDADVLRAVVIDGSNVAMSHGNKEVFSCLGIQLAVNYFLKRGHSEVTVFVPSWRKEQPRPDVPITDQHILRELEKKKILVFTPSRRVAGKRVVCNDDSFIVKHAFESDGVVVSNDMFRDLQGVNPEWKRFIEERLLMFSFVNNKFMLPDDPLGRHGPTLENFLRKFPKTRKKQPCPYGRRCTYGMRCRFHHPGRTKQKQPSVPEPSLSLVEDIQKKLNLGSKNISLEKHEHVGQGKQNHRSGRKSQTRKEKTRQQVDRSLVKDHGSLGFSGPIKDRTSQDQLDSGLGSIDSQLIETMGSLCDQQYSSYCSVQQFCPPSSPPCSCCAPGPYQPPGLVPRADLSHYSPPPHPSCCVFPLIQPAFGQHGGLHPQRPFWSDPVCICPSETHGQPGERSLWDHPPDPSRMDRAVVRKNLLAIFNAQLVDTVMNMSPDQLDPQRLVAEILMLQNQNWFLR